MGVGRGSDKRRSERETLNAQVLSSTRLSAQGTAYPRPPSGTSAKQYTSTKMADIVCEYLKKPSQHSHAKTEENSDMTQRLL